MEEGTEAKTSTTPDSRLVAAVGGKLSIDGKRGELDGIYIAFVFPAFYASLLPLDTREATSAGSKRGSP